MEPHLQPDFNGQPLAELDQTNAWVTRVADLSGFAGETPVKLATVTDWASQLGTWDIWYSDIVILGADGTVFPLFHANPNADLADAPIWITDFSAQSDNAECVEYGSSCVSYTAAQPTPTPAAGTTWFTGDHLGTAQLEFSQAGYPVWQGHFAPYGQELQGTALLAPDQPDNSTNHYKFTGQENGVNP